MENTPPYPPPPPSSQTQLSQSDERLWAMLAHLTAIILGFIGPLICWLVQKDKSAYVDYHGKEALNFNILMAIIYVGATFLAIITCGIGGLIFPVIWIGQIIFSVLAGIAANNGEMYKYPVNWRLIK